MRLENGKKVPGVEAGKTKIGVAGMTEGEWRTVEMEAWIEIKQATNEPISQLDDAAPIGVSVRVSHKLHRGAESDTKRDWKRSWPKAVLLVSAVHEGLDLGVDVAADK